MPSFVEVRFNTEIRYGLVGGPEFNTDVITVDSGHEQRNSNWLDARSKWSMGDDLYTRAQIDELIAFFRARKGKAEGFRFKDWSDFQVTVANGILGASTGMPSTTLIKRYSSGGVNYDRPITKPVSGAKVYVNAVHDPAISINTTNGVVTFPELGTATIAGSNGITKANPGVVTTTAPHGFTNGTTVYISGVAGMPEVNGRLFVVAGAASTTFQLSGENTSAYAAIGTGGTVKKYLQPGASLTWSGEFDVPARFDTDKFDCSFEAYREGDGESLFTVSGLPIIEVPV